MICGKNMFEHVLLVWLVSYLITLRRRDLLLYCSPPPRGNRDVLASLSLKSLRGTNTEVQVSRHWFVLVLIKTRDGVVCRGDCNLSHCFEDVGTSRLQRDLREQSVWTQNKYFYLLRSGFSGFT